MAVDSASAPSWLFSFVDLAFLLLIAMTQIADPNAPDLGEIVVPRLEEDGTTNLPAASGEAWQLRVHPTPEEGAPAFELVSSSAGGSERMDLDALRGLLEQHKKEGRPKPFLAPHADSRSQHLLDAVSAIEDEWPGRRRALVGRLAATR
ncbi:MAG: hypothetical protein ACQGVK_25080 [Myxococcota bacterium]